jgi:hypothetical protein
LYLFPHGKLVHYGGTLCDQTIYILKTRKTKADIFFPTRVSCFKYCSVADPEWFFPDPGPTIQLILDSDQ